MIGRLNRTVFTGAIDLPLTGYRIRMKFFVATITILFCVPHLRAQNIHLSKGIGYVNCDFRYRKFKKILGSPDSSQVYDPKRLKPIPKSLGFTKNFYDSSRLEIGYYYFMLDTLTKRSKHPKIILYSGTSVLLNGDSLSGLDSVYVVNKYGPPENSLKTGEELTLSYTFRKKKHFSVLSFYYQEDDLIKVRIDFGKYL